MQVPILAAMEISGCTSSSSIDFERDEFFKEISERPKGLSSVPDSIEIPPSLRDKPHFLVRAAISVALVFFHVITWSFQLIGWALKPFFREENQQKALYQKLYHISTEGNLGKIRQFLKENSSIEGYLFSEFADFHEAHPYLSDILRGANVCLVGDGGFFCRRWSEYSDSYPRPSSHSYREGQCFAIGNFLFWEDLEGNTRFQFENSPLRGFFDWIDHFIDFLRYRRDNEQQGVAGTSPFTEQDCLKIKINPSEFVSRKSH